MSFDGVNVDSNDGWEDEDVVFPSANREPVSDDEGWGVDAPVANKGVHKESHLKEEGWDVVEEEATIEDVEEPSIVANVPPVGRKGLLPPPPSASRGGSAPIQVPNMDIPVSQTPVQDVIETVPKSEEEETIRVVEESVNVAPTPVMDTSVQSSTQTEDVEELYDTDEDDLQEGEPVQVVEDDEGWGEDIPVAGIKHGGDSLPTGWMDTEEEDFWGEEDIYTTPTVESLPVSPVFPSVDTTPVQPTPVMEVSDVSTLPERDVVEIPAAVIPAPPSGALITPGVEVVLEDKKGSKKSTPVQDGVKKEGDKVKSSTPKKRRSNTIGGIRLTSRDLQMMSMLARYRFATVAQLAKRFETSETALRNRLPRLEKAGLITFRWAAQTQPKLWMITEKGLQTVGMTLSAPKVDYPQLRHGLGLVDLGITFELAGEIVVTEREIRAAATRYMPTPRMRSVIDMTRFMPGFEDNPDDMTLEDMQLRVERSLILPIPETHARGHIPDMVVARQPFANGLSGNIAVELELTRKPIPTWKNILTAYRDSTNFAQVYYFVMDKEIGRALKKIVQVIGAEDKIIVEAVAPRDLSVRGG